jgi:hypothetical protein
MIFFLFISITFWIYCLELLQVVLFTKAFSFITSKEKNGVLSYALKYKIIYIKVYFWFCAPNLIIGLCCDCLMFTFFMCWLPLILLAFQCGFQFPTTT